MDDPLFVRGLEGRGDLPGVGESTRFALEAAQALGVRGEGLGQQLDGDVARELGVAGTIDLAHAAGSELLDDLIMRKGLTIMCRHATYPIRSSCLTFFRSDSTSSMPRRIFAGSSLRFKRVATCCNASSAPLSNLNPA